MNNSQLFQLAHGFLHTTLIRYLGFFLLYRIDFIIMIIHLHFVYYDISPFFSQFSLFLRLILFH